jgi:hypothetical protein
MGNVSRPGIMEMKVGLRWIVGTAIYAVVVLSNGCAGSINSGSVIDRIAHDIAKLNESYPQLADFSISKNVKDLKVEYGYRTHKAERVAGWGAGVPNPDEDGIWFYIDFHEKTSRAQINAQPMSHPYCLGNLSLSFLILEGKKTKSVEGAIWQILKNHGVKRCDL